ncbi:class IV lanthionine synthetase LanL [Kitasatospora sp. NPDC008050]|uniref:class IV lanthionine synthetase LanL n=1 Tax=Kitasatospora sp. NPDC008050 TaxID=3364021 RepID=UPI0036E4C086
MRDLVRSVLTALDAQDWQIEESGVWCRVTPADHEPRVQGWKLHLSATRLSAPEVLHQASQVLVANRCAFKVARDLRLVEEMTSGTYDRAQCGKIITAYPRDDEQLRSLAKMLDLATTGLPGPAILSDRPYRKGSLVHYRYGAFHGVPVLTNDGSYEARLQGPDGSPVPDPRKPWFSPPAWAELPFPGESPGVVVPPSGAQEAKPVLLADRFVVREAIRHSAKGGVYRALDQQTGADVIVKQARAHVGGGPGGEDVRTALRREAATLTALAGICPEVVFQFEQDGHAFLVESLIPGQSLAAWVTERRAAPEGITPEHALALAGKLADLLAEVHRRGLVYQDFNPNNIMVTPEERLLLIDAEWAVAPGAWTLRAFTPGFGAPEQAAVPRLGPAYGTSTDLYSIGAVLYFLTTGTRAAFLEDSPPTRSGHQRIAELLDLIGTEHPCARLLAPAILGLTVDQPEQRWTLPRLRAFLTESAGTTRSSGPAFPAVSSAQGPQDRRRLVDDGLGHLLRTMADPAAEPARLWPSNRFGEETDACNVQYGAAGVLELLVRADELLDRAELRSGVERIAGWIDRRRTAAPRLLPGLHFGRSGTAWALHHAARHLADDALAERAADLLLALPVRWPNPDICHGAAGSGTAHLALWHATGRAEFLDRAAECADALAAAAERTADRVIWPVPGDFDSGLAGIRHLGFAHGVAGIGTFLLAVGAVTGRGADLDLAVAAGDTLVAEAERGPVGTRWRADFESKPGTGLQYHWCSGSSGVGTFLLRLWRATGEERFRQLAEEAALAVRSNLWSAPTAACHGLAGDGEFLLDLAEALPEGPYRSWAEDTAGVLYARHAVHDGLLVIPDEGGSSVTTAYQTGLAGPLSFLLRLDHGGPRPWMADAPR